MIRLLPITTAQTITIIPRDYSSITGVDMIIVEDGTWITEEIRDLNGVLTANGNFVVFQPTFSILKNENIYTITLTDSDGGLLYRDKIYCSNQTNDEVAHTLNQGLYELFESGAYIWNDVTEDWDLTTNSWSADNNYIVLD